ncbi:MAG TPA: hypothetical protein VFK38_02775 [Candidatus Limnocylindrales bacterium]|nr:hypothetical protein [Candidatus Limnocylindrales bacterium]
MKRIVLVGALVAGLALPGPALGFHHIGLPATDCHASAADSPSNNNGTAKEHLLAAGLSLPLAPIGTPGQGAGQGGDHCANG